MKSKAYQDIIDNLTISIIGPIHQQSLDNIENYKKICKNILVFAWSDINTETIEVFRDKISDDESVTLYTYKSPPSQDVKNCMFQHYKTLLPQVKGIMIAATKCQTKYMIRTRADESFSDLSPMVKKFSNDTNTIVSSNIVWRTNWGGRKKHMGDHTFIGDTQTILDVYKEFYTSAFEGFKGSALSEAFYNGIEHGCCEEHLHDYFMKHGKTPIPINVETLGEYLVSIEGKKYSNKTGLNSKVMECPDMLVDWFSMDTKMWRFMYEQE
tara:strand:+ start:2220 stop:3023 length:804 start_codon:yes stop_codon:yes gene_type:complete